MTNPWQPARVVPMVRAAFAALRGPRMSDRAASGHDEVDRDRFLPDIGQVDGTVESKVMRRPAIDRVDRKGRKQPTGAFAWSSLSDSQISGKKRRRLQLGCALAAATLVISGCMNGGVLRAPVPSSVTTIAPTATPVRVADPRPLAFPQDEGPHHRLTEWWYYTGHLHAAGSQGLAGPAGRDFGFEFVVFRAERGDFPVAWASHYAITDAAAGVFDYDQRSEFGPQVDRSPSNGGFDFSIRSPNTDTGVITPWTMSGLGGRDHLSAATSPYQIDLHLATDRPPVLHEGTGWIDLGPAGGTYYYSRTRMDVRGTIGMPRAPGAPPTPVTGLAWFDHQWGDFIAVGAGGWDWFSVQLADGRDLMISLVRGPGGLQLFQYGTLVAADGSSRQLTGDQLRIEVLNHWMSPRSGADYPAEWQVTLPDEGVTLHLKPTLPDQELDTRATSGVFYWEGEVGVDGSDHGRPIGGQGYVELTGYAG